MSQELIDNQTSCVFNGLLNPRKYGLLPSGGVGTLQTAADNGNQKAIDALAAVANDPKQTPLWYMAAKSLENSAGSGNTVAIDALIAISASLNFSWHDAQVVARLKPGVTLERAKESMAALSLQMTEKDSRGPHSVIVMPLRKELTGKTQTALVVLLCASAALLLIGCVNLANLLMSRGAVRGREVAVRVALGAGRGRLVAQFLTESLVLAGLGAAAGLALAVPAMRCPETLVPETMSTVRLTLDWRVLAFSAGVAIAATLTFGLVAALRGTRLAPQDRLREGGRGTAGAGSHRFQHWLIVVETALAVVLLTSGGLLLQTFQHLRDTDLGMQSEKLLTFVTSLFRYHDFDRRVAFVNAVLESIRVIPGVVNAGASSQIPLKVMDPQATFYWLAGQSQDRIPGQVALMRVVTRDYFRTIGGRLREGRFFENSYRRSESPVAIVNESFANRNFPGRSAIGARFKFVASLGLYGVLSYAVTQRTNEIGVRMALGATSKDILLSFGGRGLKLTLAGLAVGLVLAVIAARFMTTLLYGFRPDYVPTLAVVSLIFLAVAALASLVPARRAAKVNSMETLRYE